MKDLCYRNLHHGKAVQFERLRAGRGNEPLGLFRAAGHETCVQRRFRVIERGKFCHRVPDERHLA